MQHKKKSSYLEEKLVQNSTSSKDSWKTKPLSFIAMKER